MKISFSLLFVPNTLRKHNLSIMIPIGTIIIIDTKIAKYGFNPNIAEVE